MDPKNQVDSDGYNKRSHACRVGILSRRTSGARLSRRRLDEIPDGRGVQRIMADDIKGSEARQDSVIDPVPARVPEAADARGRYQEHGGIIRLSRPPIRGVRRPGTSGGPRPPSRGWSKQERSGAGCSTSGAERASTPCWLRAGLEALGIDAAPTAIRLAREKAARRSLDARFEVWDALDLPGFGEQFDTVLDCGLFHVFDDDDRTRFVAGLGAVVMPGGRYFMLCFSDRQPGDWGPRRVRQDELRHCFADGWRIDSIEDAVLEITLSPEGARSWFAALTRIRTAWTRRWHVTPAPNEGEGSQGNRQGAATSPQIRAGPLGALLSVSNTGPTGGSHWRLSGWCFAASCAADGDHGWPSPS